MSIDWNTKSIKQAMKDKGEGYVALELARQNMHNIVKLALRQTTQNKLHLLTFAWVILLTVAVVVLFLR
jgi:hypothetical protein